MSLIEQEDVLKAINNMIRETESVYVTSALRNFEAVVKGMRTIEPRCETCEAFNKTRLLIPQPQRKKGRWIKKTIKKKIENDYSCSECGRHVSVMRGYDVRLVYPFCHCGADMREPEDIPMEYFESGGR